jgi:8-oxo-dGTP pyrophosphatase MutT (NUDIX family)
VLKTEEIKSLDLVDICIYSKDGAFLAVTNRKHKGFTLPGGKIDPGEPPITAAVRELREETGLEIPADKLRYVGKFVHRWRGIPVVCFSFVVRTEDIPGDQTARTVEEGTVPFWVQKDDLLDDTSGCLAPAFYGWLMGKMGWDSGVN